MTPVVSKLDAASPEAREFNSGKASRFSVLSGAGNWQLCSLPYWYLLGSSWIVIFQTKGSEQDLSVQLWNWTCSYEWSRLWSPIFWICESFPSLMRSVWKRREWVAFSDMTLTSKSIRSICFLFENSNPRALHNLIFMPRWFVLSSWGIGRWCQCGDLHTRLASLMVTRESLTVSVSLLWGPLLAFVSLYWFAL